MSSTNRGAKRNPQDKYYTPASAIDPMLAVLDLSCVQSFMEPCRGGGAIFDRIDVPVKHWAEIDMGVDYLPTTMPCVDLALTNPPFIDALAFLEKSLAEAQTVGYLLRLNFHGSKKRKEFWNTHRPTHCLTLAERPVFAWFCVNTKEKKRCGAQYRPGETTVCYDCGNPVRAQTDSIEYSWFFWDGLGIVNLPSGMHVI